MPELVRSVASRVRVYFKNRRQSPRLRVRLVFTIALHRATSGNESNRWSQSLKGHTRDISTNGLALLVPQVHLHGHHLAAEGRELELRLELGGDQIMMIVVPNRYEHLDTAELGCNYLIGARIVRIDEIDRQRYLSFIGAGVQNQSGEIITRT